MRSKMVGRSVASGAAAALLLVAGLAGCGQGPTSSPSATSEFWLEIENLDGPHLTVEVNGQTMAQSVCQVESKSPVPHMTPSTSLPLPWTVTLIRADGSVMGSWTESGNDGPRQILIRGDQAGEFPAGLPGGPPAVSCQP
jgi:hypothetical protein